MTLFNNLPTYPIALPKDELRLLARLNGCEWPTNQEVDWSDRPAARRLEKRGLIKISRQKMDPVSIEPGWFAGKSPAATVALAFAADARAHQGAAHVDQ